MADLEHDVPNTPDTIFEAGSVSKQFTAAAVVLLARDGKLSLDDPVRKYIPEVGDVGAAITIRQMLHHTSGLRDWRSLQLIAGRPAPMHVYTNVHILDIISRQRALNFQPGTRWSYSNSGYNLAAILVARVSGTSLNAFSTRRIFDPLGMTHTSWRDDHTRLVKGRAIGYSEEADGIHLDMPIDDAHGSGGLLTTVGDLLKWNENFRNPRVGDAAFIAELETPGTFTDGRAHGYAFGLRVGTYRGVRQLEHSGGTGGYRGHLVRYPDRSLSVAVLCNVGSANTPQFARQIADQYWGEQANDSARSTGIASTDSDSAQLAGLYRDGARHTAVMIMRDGNLLRAAATVDVQRGREWIAQAPQLVPVSAGRFTTAARDTWDFTEQGRIRVTDPFGTISVFERVEQARPTSGQLRSFEGSYVSDEAQAEYVVGVEGSSLVLKQRPGRVQQLVPLYADAFSGGSLGTVVFRRDDHGRVTGFSVASDRVWDLRFDRTRQ